MEKTASVVIPNYNGKGLLSKNLPGIIKFFKGYEIIIVDDASTDGSVEFLNKEYPSIKIITIKKNKKFAHAANTGIFSSSAKHVFLLNSDIEITSGFTKEALGHFTDKDLFAVGFADRSHESGEITIRGRGGATFKRGFLNHFALTSQSGETLWVSGGSCVIDREKFVKLGGFDENFTPFYWEDIDLSLRAWEAGYKCFFDKNLKVDHYHEKGSIKKTKSALYIKSASYKNQFIFVWKNISDPFWILEHILWLPYHFIKALIKKDISFYFGFFWAVCQIPSLIINGRITESKIVTAEEVIKKFEKQ